MGRFLHEDCLVCRGPIAADDKDSTQRSPTELSGYCSKECARVAYLAAEISKNMAAE
jgi:hypothetical protein